MAESSTRVFQATSDPGTAKNHTLFTKVFLQCTVWSTKQKRAGGSQECSLQQVTATFSWGRKKRRPCPFELGPFAFAGRFIALPKESQALPETMPKKSQPTRQASKQPTNQQTNQLAPTQPTNRPARALQTQTLGPRKGIPGLWLNKKEFPDSGPKAAFDIPFQPSRLSTHDVYGESITFIQKTLPPINISPNRGVFLLNGPPVRFHVDWWEDIFTYLSTYVFICTWAFLPECSGTSRLPLNAGQGAETKATVASRIMMSTQTSWHQTSGRIKAFKAMHLESIRGQCVVSPSLFFCVWGQLHGNPKTAWGGRIPPISTPKSTNGTMTILPANDADGCFRAAYLVRRFFTPARIPVLRSRNHTVKA